MNFSVLMEKMAVFSVIMLIGYFFARRGLVERSFSRGASMLVLNVFLPATIVNSVFLSDMTLGAKELGWLLLVVTVALGVSFVLAWVTMRLIPMRSAPDRAPVFELLLGISNTMFVGMPIAQELFGPVAVFYCALSCIPFNVYTYTYGVWRLKRGAGGFNLKGLFSVPLVATLLATLLFLLHIPVPGVIRSVTGALNGATMPLSLLVIGLSVGSVSLVDAFKNKQLYLVSLLRLVVFPVITWLILRLMTDDPVLLTTCLLLAACDPVRARRSLWGRGRAAEHDPLHRDDPAAGLFPGVR